jgi:D-threo-aldose 1-dehydrogenase
MTILSQKQQLGTTDLSVPPIIFGTSCLGNLYQEVPYETKLAIAGEWFKYVEKPVVLDSAGKYGAGLALEMIGKTLSELGVQSDQVIISNKLGWKRVPLKGSEPTFEPGAWVGIDHDAEQHISYEGILKCYQQGCELLGSQYPPAVVSVHDPDEYLGGRADPDERNKRFRHVVGAYQALHELKAQGLVKAVGVGAKDWTVIRELTDAVELDWVMFACSLTVYTHPSELIRFMEELNRRNVGIINSAVFNAGFLIGGGYFDYRKPDPKKDADLFGWRDRFLSLCKRHDVKPATACVQFGISPPGVISVALNSSKPQRIRENVELVSTAVPAEFWIAAKDVGLIDKNYPYLG